jgi:hypothetical protein
MSQTSYATVEDVSTLWRQMSAEEQTRCEALLPIISETLRQEARNVGRDLDQMIASEDVSADVVKAVTVDVAARTLMTSTNQEPMSQMSESAMGYSVSGTFLVPGGGLFIKKSELAKLGLRRQRYGVIDFYGIDKRNGCCPHQSD